jgi:hypothetical protein
MSSVPQAPSRGLRRSFAVESRGFTMLRVPSTKWHFFFVSFGEKRGCFVWPFRVFCYIKINGSQTVRQDDGLHPPVAKFYVARHRERFIWMKL